MLNRVREVARDAVMRYCIQSKR